MSFILKFFKGRKNKAKLTICGLDKAGKTTLINYILEGEVLDTVPTTGVNRSTIDFPKLQLDIFDLGGQISFRSMWANYNEKSDGIIFVVDSTDNERLNESKTVFHEIVQKQMIRNIPVLILLHKVDLENRLSIEDFINKFELTDVNLEIQWAIFETSVITGQGIQEAFQWIINFFGGK